MNIAGKSVLITGSNRGIGRALVDEALKRGAKRVYAGVRNETKFNDSRVIPLILDVTNNSQITEAAAQIESLDVLIKDRKSTRLNSSHSGESRMPSSA